jgi:hypothetical protein
MRRVVPAGDTTKHDDSVVSVCVAGYISRVDSDWTLYRELTDTFRELRDRMSKERAGNDAVRERPRRAREASGALKVRLHRRRRTI